MSITANEVKVFKGSINEIDAVINHWAHQSQVRIVNASMTYDDKGPMGSVFVIVVYERTWAG
jgi:hypothetical protein